LICSVSRVRRSRSASTRRLAFGQLLHANEAAAGGVFLLRFPVRARADLPGAVLKLVAERGAVPPAEWDGKEARDPTRVRSLATPGEHA